MKNWHLAFYGCRNWTFLKITITLQCAGLEIMAYKHSKIKKIKTNIFSKYPLRDVPALANQLEQSICWTDL